MKQIQGQMKKIKSYLIHLLGGYTAEDVALNYTTLDCADKYARRYYLCGQQSITDSLKTECKLLYGKSAEEWCKQMYTLIHDLSDHVDANVSVQP